MTASTIPEPAPIPAYGCAQCGKSFTSADGGSLIVCGEQSLAFCSGCGLPVGLTAGPGSGSIEIVELRPDQPSESP